MRKRTWLVLVRARLRRFVRWATPRVMVVVMWTATRLARINYADLIRDVLIFGGVMLLAAGAADVYAPAGRIVAGAGLLYMGAIHPVLIASTTARLLHGNHQRT